MSDGWQGHVAGVGVAGAATAAAPVPAPAPGGVLADLVGGLARAGVRYCRWKRRLDLPRLLRGEGDLDLLVAAADVPRFLEVAGGLGFLPGVRGWDPPADEELHLYGLDPAAGELLHLHVHVRLLGGPAAPGAPTLEGLVLGHTRPTEGVGPLDGMPVVEPEAELIVLVLRTLLDGGLNRPAPAAVRGRLGEALAACPAAGARDLLGRELPSVPPELFDECVAALTGNASWARRARLARRLRAALGVGRGPSALRGARAVLAFGWWRMFHGRAAARRPAGGGAVIALVGPEACGKSTLGAETAGWLGRVFRVRTAHLGKPPATWLTLLPNLARRLARRVPRLRARHGQAAAARGEGGRPGLLRSAAAVLLAWDRAALARRLARQAARGWVVVCDRYPSALVGAADSARLSAPADGGGGLRGYLARLEQALYRRVPAPTLMVRLTAPLGVAVERNRERYKVDKESDAYVTSRHRNYVAPSFPGTPTVVLDTNEPRPATAAALRLAVWRVLSD
jgi:thymidylate kinase